VKILRLHRANLDEAGREFKPLLIFSAVNHLSLRLDVASFFLESSVTLDSSNTNSNYMKSCLVTTLALGLLVSSVPAQDKPDLTDLKQKTSYALGMDIVSTLKQQEVDVDTKALAAGMADMLAGKPALTPEEQKAAINDLSKEMVAKEEEERKIAAVKNLKDGQGFLAANAKKEGVKVMEVTTPDGSKAELQYEVIKSGTGPSPKKTDIVEVHYECSGIDGTVFDSSVKRGIPATFGMDQVIPGWTAALEKMRVGDKWRLFIPPNLGYGEFGPPQIPPNSTLIFDLELISFYTPAKVNSASPTNTPPALEK
jgi:FKBP-type peptidyl-prolyl cis-trans isomerase